VGWWCGVGRFPKGKEREREIESHSQVFKLFDLSFFNQFYFYFRKFSNPSRQRDTFSKINQIWVRYKSKLDENSYIN